VSASTAASVERHTPGRHAIVLLAAYGAVVLWGATLARL